MLRCFPVYRLPRLVRGIQRRWHCIDIQLDAADKPRHVGIEDGTSGTSGLRPALYARDPGQIKLFMDPADNPANKSWGRHVGENISTSA